MGCSSAAGSQEASHRWKQPPAGQASRRKDLPASYRWVPEKLFLALLGKRAWWWHQETAVWEHPTPQRKAVATAAALPGGVLFSLSDPGEFVFGLTTLTWRPGSFWRVTEIPAALSTHLAKLSLRWVIPSCNSPESSASPATPYLVSPPMPGQGLLVPHPEGSSAAHEDGSRPGNCSHPPG